MVSGPNTARPSASAGNEAPASGPGTNGQKPSGPHRRPLPGGFHSLQISQGTNFAPENLVVFLGPTRKYIRNKENGAEGAKYFLAGQISQGTNFAPEKFGGFS